MQKELWRKRWLESINELTSLTLQKQSWLDKTNKSNPHWSFVEFRCCYFDDLGIYNDYDYQLKNEWITKKEFDIIKPWHKMMDQYNSPKNDDYDVEAILADKNWLSIIEVGEKTKKELSKVINQKEKEILFENVDYTKYL